MNLDSWVCTPLWFLLGALATYLTVTLLFRRKIYPLHKELFDEVPSKLLFFSLLSAHTARLAVHRKEIEGMELEAQELIRRYQLLTENLAAAVVIRDAQGRITYCSPYTEVLTGYALSEIYASSQDFFQTIAHEEDSALYGRAMRVTSVGEPFQFRYRFYHKTGIEMWAETRTVPVLDHEGGLRSSLSITLDVTGLLRYQRQVEEKNKDLEDFTYMVSHDLKAPIFTIKGMAALVTEDTSVKDETKELLDHIRKATERLESLVDGVLKYAQISAEGADSARIGLQGVITEVLNDYKTRMGDSQVKVQSELPVVIGDHIKLYQIFSNLLGNALKYRSMERQLELNISSDSTESNHYVLIKVSDNGAGIPGDKLEAVFRPFQRAHGNEIEGSGIGLACVKKLLEKMGGDIQVTSTVGKGSTFLVKLRSG